MPTQSLTDLIQNRDIVIIGLQSWDDDKLGSNCKDIALQFAAQRNRVIYVNYALNRMDLMSASVDPLIEKRKSALKGLSPDLVRVKDNFWSFYPKTFMEPVNRLKPAFLFDFVNWINNKRLAREIKSAIKRLGFKNVIIFNDQEMYRGFHLKALLKPETYIYYVRDNLIHTDYFRKNGTRLEPRLIASSDLVVCNSTYLRDYAFKYNANSYFVGQGCDLKLFDPERTGEIPFDMLIINGPRIGYIGALVSFRLDIALVTELAQKNKGWNFVFVGPEDDAFTNSELHHLYNVHFIGSRPLEELPVWMKHFDVCINPQLVNEMTIGNYPRKADEYLAMGKPLVARHTQAMEMFSPVCYLAEDADTFAHAIRRALQEDSATLRHIRREFALEHSWENSFSEISRAYYQFKNPREWKPAT